MMCVVPLLAAICVVCLAETFDSFVDDNSLGSCSGGLLEAFDGSKVLWLDHASETDTLFWFRF